MSQSVYTLAEDTDAAAAARMMLRHGLKSVPVVAGERVVGIVARRDLLRLVARGDDEIRADLDAACGTRYALLAARFHVDAGIVTIPGPARSAASSSWASPARCPAWSRSAPATCKDRVHR